ncbi:MAG: biotin--[Clostridia bacterium]|nr:biotin--[acetyl-CoA-carboxylase] ligase [Clostridia bacterium]
MEGIAPDLRRDVIAEAIADVAELPITLLPLADSTNTLAAGYAAENTDAALALFIADSQSCGRGRLGRSFLSRKGVGLYLSLLVRRRVEARDALGLTTLAAVAVCEALERLTPLKPKIKWVNDIYVNDRKLAGILTEGRLSSDGSSNMEYAIVGIGINVKRQDMASLDQPATDIESECGLAVERDRLAGEICRIFLSRLGDIGEKYIFEQYTSRSCLDGRRVMVIKPSLEREATVIGIREDFSLHIRYDDGSEEFLNTGEVSTKIK